MPEDKALDLKNKYFNTNRPSVRTHGSKLQAYYDEFNPQTIEELFDKENLELFIFVRGTKPANIRDALVSLFEYAREIGYIGKYDVFPIPADQVHESRGDEKTSELFFIPRKYDLSEFYREDLKAYKNKEDRLIIRAFIALCLGAGYKPGDVQKMKLSDYDNLRKTVKNPYKSFDSKNDDDSIVVNEISLIPPALDCIQEFWDYFWSNKKTTLLHNENFIESVSKKRPIYLVRKTLNEVSLRLKLSKKVTPTDLRCNMFLHSLYKSNGATLIDLMRLIGRKDSTTLLTVLNEYYQSLGMEMIQSFDPETNDTDNESNLDSLSTIRIETTVARIVRDSKLAQSLKTEYGNMCQICGLSINIKPNFMYSEVHHIKPIGKPHNGPDVWENMLVLCPNHHAMFDLGAIAIHPETYKLYFINSNSFKVDENISISILSEKHKINPKYLKYHWEKKFVPNLFPIKK